MRIGISWNENWISCVISTTAGDGGGEEGGGARKPKLKSTWGRKWSQLAVGPVLTHRSDLYTPLSFWHFDSSSCELSIHATAQGLLADRLVLSFLQYFIFSNTSRCHMNKRAIRNYYIDLNFTRMNRSKRTFITNVKSSFAKFLSS